MNKKRLVLAASAMVLVATMIAGGSLAYFTNTASVTNTITFGNVKIGLTEPTYLPNGNHAVVPGATIVKDPTITNEGNNDCYVRVKLDVNTYTGSGDNEVPSTVKITAAQLMKTSADWKLATDGYYYYQKKLPAKKDNVVTMFEKLVIPSDWDNTYANLTFKLIVRAEAIQADNFDPTMSGSDIVGWGSTPIV